MSHSSPTIPQTTKVDFQVAVHRKPTTPDNILKNVTIGSTFLFKEDLQTQFVVNKLRVVLGYLLPKFYRGDILGIHRRQLSKLSNPYNKRGVF